MVAKFKPHQTWYDYTYGYPDGYVEDGINLTDVVFYIGKGTEGRIDEHEREAQKGCMCVKCEVIHKIWTKGYAVKKRIVFETLVEAEAIAKEKELLKKHAGRFLTNIRIPGKSYARDSVQQTTWLDQRHYNVIQASKYIGADPKTIRRWLKQGKMTGIRTERGWLAIPEEQVEQARAAWIREQGRFSTPSPAQEPTSQIDILTAKVAELERRLEILENRED